MGVLTCEKQDCTVAVTGTCLLAHSPPTTCPHYGEGGTAIPEVLQPLPTTVVQQVYSGLELGTQEAAELMASRYGHLAAVLGDTDAGKTCFLCAMYLLASCRELHPHFAFAGSRTLPGFEARLRLIRNWDRTDLPQKIVDHTFLKDPRRPGLLHLVLREHVTGRTLDLFFTDLPGEWSQQVVEHTSYADRLTFLRRADSIIIAFDTGLLRQAETRHVQLQWGRLLLQRLLDAVKVAPDVPLVLMLTKCDLYGSDIPEYGLRLQEVASSLGFTSTRLVPVASFSSRPNEIASGTGIATVLDTIAAGVLDLSRRPQTPPGDSRCFLRFRTTLLENGR